MREGLRRIALTLACILGAAGVFMAARPQGAEATYPGRNGSLLMSVAPAGGPDQLWLIDPSGHHRGHIRAGGACYGEFLRAAVDPSGQSVVFSDMTHCGLGTGTYGYTLVVAGLNGAPSRVLARFRNPTKRLFYEFPGSVAFSPDGRTIAWGVDETGRVLRPGGGFAPVSQHIVDFISARTGKIIRVMKLPYGLTGPAWSSTGKLAFVSTDGQVWTTPAHALHLRQLRVTFSSPGAWSVTHVDWAPNGRRLALDATKDTSDCCPPTDIFTLAAQGGTTRRLTHSGNASDAVWSPDGKEIAFRDGSLDKILVIASTRAHLLSRRLSRPVGVLYDFGVLDWQPLP
jgi:Tol biopolymer transport system component